MTTLLRVLVREPDGNSLRWLCRVGEGGCWIADCPDLGITIQSDNYGELLEDAADAVELLRRDQVREGGR